MDERSAREEMLDWCEVLYELAYEATEGTLQVVPYPNGDLMARWTYAGKTWMLHHQAQYWDKVAALYVLLQDVWEHEKGFTQ